MRLADMREEVRDTLSVNLSNDLIDGWLRRGHRKIAQAAEWPWHYVDLTTTLVQSGGATAATSITRARRVINVFDTYSGDLQEIAWRTALDRFVANTGSPTAAYPSYYSVIEDHGADADDSPVLRVRLWPASDTDRADCVVSYLRAVGAWPTRGIHETAEPSPLPDEMHDLLVTWALNEANIREGDTAMAAPYYSSFNSDLEMLRDKYVQTSGTDVRVGGGNDIPSRYFF